MKPAPLEGYRLTDHARQQMLHRGISDQELDNVLADPEQCDETGSGRVVYQARILRGSGPRTYLMRVFVDISDDPPAVVTVYVTSRVDRYWR
ncbi:MAG: DUF4258 domain-containing protein [Anaerolineae bacterium]|nr:DUF4258 domain-containing protein [Anaerolineae bacterium]